MNVSNTEFVFAWDADFLEICDSWNGIISLDLEELEH